MVHQADSPAQSVPEMAIGQRKRPLSELSLGERIFLLRGSGEILYDPFKRARKLLEPLMPRIRPKFLRKEEYIQWLRKAVGYKPPELTEIKPEAPSRPVLSESDCYRAQELVDRKSDAVVCYLDKIELLEKDFHTLKPGRWLNDEIINGYIKLLVTGEIPLRVHAFNTFFWSTISSFEPKTKKPLSYDYAKVKRWTRRQKVDIFDLDLIIVPVNINEMHWTLGCIDMRAKKVRFYDSLGTPSNSTFADFMIRYVKDEHKDKKGSALSDADEWEAEDVIDNPQQDNGYDCGVFLCKYAECLVNDISFNFSQSDIENCRYSMALELFEGKVRNIQD
eukprot:GEMP01068160.1.p1 GENE.GEMP01068160.1~~GEMP01068160.1.p1  ORF type:complete len:334 (+),score=46.19 GEMP01068160.1:196-1197(+)